jgi:NADPH:quinone reductase-like Zn-dependent oxidoreductase
VIGTASAGNHGFLRGLGADELIDYRTADFAEAVRDVDVVLDAVGGDTQVRSLRTLRRGGVLISLLPLEPRGGGPGRAGRRRGPGHAVRG